MSSPGPKLVNKQFNSPIKLYSPQALQETLDRQTKVLANGAVGIDFNQLAKPTNLQNSAVLRMLEEEEARQRAGHPSLKRVAWPPPPEDQDTVDFVENSPVQAKTRGEWVSYETIPSSVVSPKSPITTTATIPPIVKTQISSASPSSPGGTLRQPSHFQQQVQAKTWSPVTPPLATSPIPHQQSSLQQNNIPPQQLQQPWKQNSAESFDHQSPKPKQSQTIPIYQPCYEPPPSIITLRPEPPISQIPAPVYLAQPAATMAPIAGNMRGDTKWPPESVKAQTEAENNARLELAKGPAVRPRRVRKDYSGFFAQHALNSSYPGYRAPPGTQYFAPGYQQ